MSWEEYYNAAWTRDRGKPAFADVLRVFDMWCMYKRLSAQRGKV